MLSLLSLPSLLSLLLLLRDFRGKISVIANCREN
jgi:hypothetical protein